MATKRVMYFTAGRVPTGGELAEIAALNALAAQPFEVVVRNALDSPNFGAGIEAADYKAGSPPVAYAGVTAFPTGTALYPLSSLPADHAIVKNGQKRNGVTGAGANVVATFTVAAGVVSAIACATT